MNHKTYILAVYYIENHIWRFWLIKSFLCRKLQSSLSGRNATSGGFNHTASGELADLSRTEHCNLRLLVQSVAA